jgi:hypothetical protein
MTKIIFLFFIITFIGVYFYFGFYQDYKRNPKEYIRTIIGMPLGIFANTFGWKNLDAKLKKWANLEEEQKTKFKINKEK